MKEGPASAVGGSLSLLLLFASFLRMGLTAFGGPAMVAYIRKKVVGRKHWLDPDAFHSGVALCQAIPGATVMQLAAYVGLKLRGVRGAICCYIGFGLPAFLLMLALSMAYSRAHALPAVISVFSGLQAVVVAIVANATVSFGKTALTHWKHGLIALVAAGLFVLKVNPILIVLLAALLGLLLNGRPPASRKAAPTGRMEPTTRPLLFLLFVSGAAFTLLFIFSSDLFRLALLMSKIDLLAFGGGFASVPLMFHEFVEVRAWMDGPTFLNGIVLGQFTPGPIVITATFVGYQVYGFWGAIVATGAISCPPSLF